MKQITLGRSGIVSPQNGFGALPIQRVSFEYAGMLLMKAYDAGFTYFDTARAYSDSEEKMGRALKDIRKNIAIATKTGASDADTFWNHLHTSLRNLQTDYIDVYQFHNPACMPRPDDGFHFHRRTLPRRSRPPETADPFRTARPHGRNSPVAGRCACVAPGTLSHASVSRRAGTDHPRRVRLRSSPVRRRTVRLHVSPGNFRFPAHLTFPKHTTPRPFRKENERGVSFAVSLFGVFAYCRACCFFFELSGNRTVAATETAQNRNLPNQTVNRYILAVLQQFGIAILVKGIQEAIYAGTIS